MTWEQKLAKLGELTECSLRMRKPGDWFVSQDVAHGGDGSRGSIFGEGDTPKKAVEEHWLLCTTKIPKGIFGEELCVIVNPCSPTNYRKVRWNGASWEELT